MMMLDTTPKLYKPERAVEIADELNESDDWTYTPTNPDGDLGPFSAIVIHDEDGERVGYWHD